MVGWWAVGDGQNKIYETDRPVKKKEVRRSSDLVHGLHISIARQYGVASEVKCWQLRTKVRTALWLTGRGDRPRPAPPRPARLPTHLVN